MVIYVAVRLDRIAFFRMMLHMRKRLLAVLALVLAVSLTGFAQDEKKQPDRVSGSVRSVDQQAMSIEVNLSSSPSVVRTVLWDQNTKVTLVDKPGTSADIKEGMRIVAIGKFEGVKLRATALTVRPR